MKKMYPCDGAEGFCPFDAVGGMDCRNYCGLGVDESGDDDDYDEINYYPDESMQTYPVNNIEVLKDRKEIIMATINTINNEKNAVQIYTEFNANGTKIEYITVDDRRIGILGSVSENDREAALKVLNDAYVASNGNVYEMMQKLMTVATITEKEVEPDEMIEICGEDIMLSYSKAKAYTMDGAEIANCDDLPSMPNEAIKAVLVARVEAALK